MKKVLFASALMFAFGVSMAQDVTTYSVYDSNQSNTLDVTDVTGTVDQVAKNVDPSTTAQYVTAEDLRDLLQVINAKLDKLEKMQKKLNALSELTMGMAQEQKVPIPEELQYPFNGYDHVDLGITDANGNTVYWATNNVGALHAWEYGYYFAWGETIPYHEDAYQKDFPYTTLRTVEDRPITGYNWETYQYSNGEWTNLTKYCNLSEKGNQGFTDTKTVLDVTDDAAHAYMGGAWRLPTADEQDLLLTQCYWQWVDNYKDEEVAGFVVFKAKSPDDKGKGCVVGEISTSVASYSVSTDTHIFLPASGSCFLEESTTPSLLPYDDFMLVGTCGNYWSSSLDLTDPLQAERLNFMKLNPVPDIKRGGMYRYVGLTVRAVCQ